MGRLIVVFQETFVVHHGREVSVRCAAKNKKLLTALVQQEYMFRV
jgi:hypothetical protein